MKNKRLKTDITAGLLSIRIACLQCFKDGLQLDPKEVKDKVNEIIKLAKVAYIEK